jgi:hypothetical protein
VLQKKCGSDGCERVPERTDEQAQTHGDEQKGGGIDFQSPLDVPLAIQFIESARNRSSSPASDALDIRDRRKFDQGVDISSSAAFHA